MYIFAFYHKFMYICIPDFFFLFLMNQALSCMIEICNIFTIAVDVTINAFSSGTLRRIEQAFYVSKQRSGFFSWCEGSKGRFQK